MHEKVLCTAQGVVYCQFVITWNQGEFILREDKDRQIYKFIKGINYNECQSK